MADLNNCKLSKSLHEFPGVKIDVNGPRSRIVAGGVIKVGEMSSNSVMASQQTTLSVAGKMP